MESANKTPYLTTFQVCNKTPEKVYICNPNPDIPPRNCVERLKPYIVNKCIRVLRGTEFTRPLLPFENGFVSTVVQCYNKHHNLVLRPDDVWLAIMTQFSLYINKHAEKFRKQFVNFDGQEEMFVKVGGSIDDYPYDRLIKQMLEEMDRNLIDGKLKEWILPDFSSTTEADKVTFGVVFMASMKNYFKYKMGLCCGIPNITLDGTVEDWKEIETRIQKLREYELGDWVSKLEPILSQFTEAKSGKVDLEFWNRICSNVGGGSGPQYLSGWITAFCRFGEDGNFIGSNIVDGKEMSVNAPWPYVDTIDIPNGFVEVDVTLDDGRNEYKSVMFSGHFAAIVEEDEVTLKPARGWVIVLKHPLQGE